MQSSAGLGTLQLGGRKPVARAPSYQPFWTLWEAMLAHAGALHLIVSTSDSDPLTRPASYGYYLHDAAAVWVRPDRARVDMAATLAHELAHAVTHDACARMPRDVREVVAESVASAVCSRFGLDLSLRSVDYVAGWLDEPEASAWAWPPFTTTPRL